MIGKKTDFLDKTGIFLSATEGPPKRIKVI